MNRKPAGRRSGQAHQPEMPGQPTVGLPRDGPPGFPVRRGQGGGRGLRRRAAAGGLRRVLGGGGGSSTADDVLNIGLPVTPKDFSQTTKYLAAFTKKTGITVKPFTTNTATNTWVAVFQEVSTRLAGGEAIDSAYIATEGMQLFEKRGVLEPLNSYIATDQQEVNSFYSDVSPNMLANFRQLDDLKGQTYFIPIGYNVMSMWYNRKLFKSLGIAEPAPDWTWADFEKAAAKFTGLGLRPSRLRHRRPGARAVHRRLPVGPDQRRRDPQRRPDQVHGRHPGQRRGGRVRPQPGHQEAGQPARRLVQRVQRGRGRQAGHVRRRDLAQHLPSR